VWRLDEDARAVAGVLFAAAGASVFEIGEDLNSISNDIVGLARFYIDDKTHAAGIVLVQGVIQTLLGRKHG
jgi:hypothetical protein